MVIPQVSKIASRKLEDLVPSMTAIVVQVDCCMDQNANMASNGQFHFLNVVAMVEVHLPDLIARESYRRSDKTVVEMHPVVRMP